MIDARVANFGTVVNGWLANAQLGLFGTDYLFRAAVPNGDLGVISHRKHNIHSHLQIVKEIHLVAIAVMKYILNQDKLHQWMVSGPLPCLTTKAFS